MEVDSIPIIKQRMQQKLLNLRKFFKKNKIKYKNLAIKNQSIEFQLINSDIEKFEKLFLNKENPINPYYGQYRSYEMDHFIENEKIRIE